MSEHTAEQLLQQTPPRLPLVQQQQHTDHRGHSGRHAQFLPQLPCSLPAPLTLNLVTLLPTSVTYPTISWPGTMGYTEPFHSFLTMWRSEWLREVEGEGPGG